MKKILLAALLCCSYLSQSQIFEETTAGVYVVLPQEEFLSAGIGFTSRPMWELNDNLYLGGNLGVEIYFFSEEEEFFFDAESPYLLSVGPSLRYYILEYLYGGVDASYNIEISGASGSGIRAFPHVGYSFETFNLEAGYQFFKADEVDFSGLTFGLYFKW